MIKNIAKKSLLVALLAGIGFGATAVQAQERVYVIDQRDVVALSGFGLCWRCLLYTSPSPRDRTRSRMPSSA